MKKKKTYNHLDVNERYLIAVLRVKRLGIREIVRELVRSPSSISQKFQRNAPPILKGYYLAHRAHQRYVLRNQQRVRGLRLKTKKIRSYVTRHLKMDWSPELISGRLTHLSPHQTINHEAIYQWIYLESTELIGYLVRHHRKRFSFRHTHRHAQNQIPGCVSINQRSKVIHRRKQFGH
jgi:IS30 family transposase